MTILEAKQIFRDFYDTPSPSKEQKFLFSEAAQFLIRETKDPAYMVELGGMYYDDLQFDLALKK